MSFRKGTSSIEYLFILGITMGFLVILISMSVNISNDAINTTLAKETVESLSNSADYVSSLGVGSKETVDVRIPKNVEFINVSDKRIHIKFLTSSGVSDVYAKTSTEVVGFIKPTSGIQEISVCSKQGGIVEIGYGENCSYSLFNSSRINHTINTTQNDFQGPIVSNLSYLPKSPCKNQAITLFGDVFDNSTVAGCQVAVGCLDLICWSEMSAADGNFDEQFENIISEIGTAAGKTAYVRCADIFGNMGETVSIEIPIKSKPKDIIFLTFGDIPSSEEVLWINWINTHESGLPGNQWNMDVISQSEIENGDVKLEDYSTVIVAEEAEISPAPIYDYLKTYMATNYIIILSGASVKTLQRLGLDSGGGSGQQRELSNQINITSRSPITYGLTSSVINITNSNNYIYYPHLPTVTTLATVRAKNKNEDALLLGQNTITFGASNPSDFTAEGDIIARNIIDLAIMNSPSSVCD